MQNKGRNSFAVGAIIITLGMLAVKVFGAIFKIPLMSILGGEGSGYFLGAYNLYNPIYALSTAGLPIAVSRLVSENLALGRFKDVKKILKIVSPIFLLTGSIGFFVIIVGAFIYADLAKSPGSIYSTFMLAPTLFFSCLISTYRGYYEGLRQMIPTAVSEVIESIGKVIFGLSFTYFLNYYSFREYENNGTIFGRSFDNLESAKDFLLPFSSGAALLGVAVSAFVGYIYMLFRHKLIGDKITDKELLFSPKPCSYKSILKHLLKLSVPIALGAIIMNIAGVVDSILIQRQLAQITKVNLPRLINMYKNLITDDIIKRGVLHIFLSGCFGYASTLVMFLPTLSQGVAISTLPTITYDWSKNMLINVQKKVKMIIKLTTIVIMPMGFGLSMFSYPIMDLIYNFSGSDLHLVEIKIASSIMAISGLGAIFISLSTPICSMLQAISRPDLPVKILGIGVFLKIMLNYILVGIPEINIQGASIGTLVCYSFVFICALYNLCKITKLRINIISTFIKPIIASFICSLSAVFFYNLIINSLDLNKKIITLVSILISSFIYVFVLLILKTLNYDDLNSLPKGRTIANFLRRFNFI